MKSARCPFEEQVTQGALLPTELLDHVARCAHCKQTLSVTSSIARMNAKTDPPSADKIWRKYRLRSDHVRVTSVLVRLQSFERYALWGSCLVLVVVGVIACRAPFSGVQSGVILAAGALAGFLVLVTAVMLAVVFLTRRITEEPQGIIG